MRNVGRNLVRAGAHVPTVNRVPIDEQDLAARIVDAHAGGVLLPAPADHGLDGPAAYRVQTAVVAARRTTRRVGWKLGYTSEAMRRQMGIDEPNIGPLYDEMMLANGAQLAAGAVQPRVEPEIAAVIGSTVRHAGELAEAVVGWYAALEVVDSVWEDYRFDWALNTADGSSGAFVVLGDRLADGGSRALAGLPVTLLVDDEEVETGNGAAAMGDPRLALTWLIGQLALRGDRLQPGDVVITGGLTRAVPLGPGSSVQAAIGSGRVRISRV